MSFPAFSQLVNVCASPGKASSVLVVSPGLLSSLKQWLPNFCFHSGRPLCGRSQEPANRSETGPHGLGAVEPGRLARLGSVLVCAEQPSSAAATEPVQPVEPCLYLLLGPFQKPAGLRHTSSWNGCRASRTPGAFSSPQMRCPTCGEPHRLPHSRTTRTPYGFSCFT